MLNDEKNSTWSFVLDEHNRGNLRSFLIKELENITDADPEALTEYIFALLTKDVHIETLKEICSTQLREFLENSTQKFVKVLFNELERNYVTSIEAKEWGNDETNDNQEDKNGWGDERYEDIKPDNDRRMDPRSYNRDDRPQRDFSPDRKRKRHSDKNDWGSDRRRDKRFHNDNDDRNVPQKRPQSCRIEITNIPPPSCTKDSVEQYYSQFGPINDIVIFPTQKRALVTYQTLEAARLAIRDPQAPFGNRFVKIYYKDAIQPESLQPPTDSEPMEVTSPVESLPKNPSIIQQRKENIIKKKNELKEQMEALERKQKEAREILIGKLDKVPEAEREEILKSLSAVSKSLSTKPAPPQPPLHQVAPAVQAVNSFNGNTFPMSTEQDLKQKLLQLKAQHAALGLSKKLPKSKSIDLRPKFFSFQADHSPLVYQQHFQQFGNLVYLGNDPNKPNTIYVGYENRWEAENAMKTPLLRGDGTNAPLTWVQPDPPAQYNHLKNITNEIVQEIVMTEDEEDDGFKEKSWKR